MAALYFDNHCVFSSPPLKSVRWSPHLFNGAFRSFLYRTDRFLIPFWLKSLGNGYQPRAGLLIAETDFHPLEPSERHDSQKAFAEAKLVQIMENVFIGARVVVLKSVTIGVGPVIGAGIVVTQDIPACYIAAGSSCFAI